MNQDKSTQVAVVGGARIPFVKAGTRFKKHSTLSLAVHSVNGLLHKQQLDPQCVDTLVCGVVVVDPRILHLAREVAFSSQLPADVANFI